MKFKLLIISGILLTVTSLTGQTVIPNPGFENWTNFGSYTDPTGWDTPNNELMAIPFFGISVVTKSTDHHGAGSFSAKLETKHLALPPLDVPGFMTCGNLTIDLTAGTYIVSGGIPLLDMPTHLKGFYKYIPKGGDSCVIGIGLTRRNGSVTDTVGVGVFSTKDTISDWTPFSAWINYISPDTPDTMNIIAISTAQEIMTVGTILYVDDLYLDYTVGYDKTNPAAGITTYNDRETSRLMIFCDFINPEATEIKLFSMTGNEIRNQKGGSVKRDRFEIPYSGLSKGIYVLEILHDGKCFTRKFFLNQ
ncbi:MAG: hypothetical protein ACOYNC_02785 [Bacteroidales bacterium]